MAKAKEAHVICNNDSVEGVVLGDKGEALTKMNELSFTRWKNAFHKYGSRTEYVEYQKGRQEYWHIHTTKIY